MVIFRQLVCSEENDDAIEGSWVDKQEEHTTKDFQDTIYALDDDANFEEPMQFLLWGFAGHRMATIYRWTSGTINLDLKILTAMDTQRRRWVPGTPRPERANWAKEKRDPELSMNPGSRSSLERQVPHTFGDLGVLAVHVLLRIRVNGPRISAYNPSLTASKWPDVGSRRAGIPRLEEVIGGEEFELL